MAGKNEEGGDILRVEEYFCDRCGKRLKSESDGVYFSFETGSVSSYEVELCRECAAEFGAIVDKFMGSGHEVETLIKTKE